MLFLASEMEIARAEAERSVQGKKREARPFSIDVSRIWELATNFRFRSGPTLALARLEYRDRNGRLSV